MSSFFNARGLSLAAVCFQSTALAIVLHISQASLRPGQAHYKASSAVLLTELGKLVLSLLLALRDTLKERATLLAPRHNLPSPELYAQSQPVDEKELWRDDPYDTTSQPSQRSDPVQSLANNLRRRSSIQRGPTFSVSFEGGGTTFPERSSLATFQWPHKPISPAVAEKLGKISPEGSPQPDLQVLKMLDDPRLWLRRRRLGVVGMLWEDIFGGDWWKMAVPAVLFALQNNLIYVAARNLSVPVFQITFQLKTLITALCAVVMLGRRLSSIQWASLVTLGLGVATMQLGAISARENDSHGHGKHPATEAESMNYLAGVSAVLVSCFSSAIAATYFELVIKRQPVVPPVEEIMLVAPPKIKPASLWVRNIQLSLFSSVIGVAVVMLQANHFHLDAISGLSLDFKGLFDPLEHWYDPVVRAGEGFFEGLTDNPMAWAVIFLQTVGGLLIAVAIKHADNIAKGFALAVSIVFTFLLSVVLFDFQPTLASVLGGAAVVASTIMFEMAPKEIRGLFAAEPHGHKKAVMRRWHYMLVVIMGTTLWAGIFPSIRSLSSGTGKWDLLHHEHDNQLSLRQPTIAIADMTPITEKLTKAAHICGWGVRPFRETTTSAYGGSHPMPSSYPYWVTNANQYALDDILTTRFATYPKAVPLLASPSPDFIFLPILSQLWSNPWRCEATELRDAIERTTQFLRDLVASVGETPYPRIVVPIATLRSNLEEILAPELMAELKDSVVFVSIENAPKTHAEGLKYLIDVPYPTAFHLSSTHAGSKTSVGDYFLEAERPYLLHYAAGASHPWGLPASDPFNGFALRGALLKEFSDYVAAPAENQKSPILFDNIENSVDGAQNLTLFHEHMSQAVFCPMPAGDSPSRRAFYEALQLGCIPVIFRERSYGRLFPSSPEINDLSKFTVFVDETELITGSGLPLIQRLEAISPVEVRRMQHHIRKIAHKLQWAIPEDEEWIPKGPGHKLPSGVPVWSRTVAAAREEQRPPTVDAFTMLLKELAVIRDGEWVPGVARDLRRGVTGKSFGRPARRR
ncbi:hypothetical protein Rhopal_000786-T1 [Rhodotorula paludigena]|uniref:Exostosin GT47 domain-containing protein n=1 Tax=Rhodotorula paludigena TaxID=86838 RepID=A0AAV5G5L2_9BASI|nr:hypothetical protein Rhopal_000786-T1 [Rhodotorula paludigena]